MHPIIKWPGGKRKEKNILINFKKEFEKLDPDILWAENGNLIIPYIKRKLNNYCITIR